jgi:hypothetical protein
MVGGDNENCIYLFSTEWPGTDPASSKVIAIADERIYGQANVDCTLFFQSLFFYKK